MLFDYACSYIAGFLRISSFFCSFLISGPFFPAQFIGFPLRHGQQRNEEKFITSMCVPTMTIVTIFAVSQMGSILCSLIMLVATYLYRICFIFIFLFNLWSLFQLDSSTALSDLGKNEIKKNSSLVCVPIMADSADLMIVDTHKAKTSGADIVEIRLDSLKIFNPQEDLKTLIEECPLPTLFTYRFSQWNLYLINQTILVILHF